MTGYLVLAARGESDALLTVVGAGPPLTEGLQFGLHSVWFARVQRSRCHGRPCRSGP